MVFKKLVKGKKSDDEDTDVQTKIITQVNGLPLPGHSSDEGAPLHPEAHEEGGFACTNDTLLKQQREAITTWIKSMGKKLLSGSLNLINTPFPVTIFEPRSYLEKLADVWVYPKYMTAAASATDPLERMKLVVTWFVAGLHHGFEKWRKPFNPILGETWQASLSDGTSMFMEQISHHPPVSAFHMEGPGGAYRFRGLSQPTVSIVIKYYGFKTVAKGFRFAEFADGSRIDIHYPAYYIKNVVYSNRPRAEVDGQAIFVDKRNNLKAVIDFGAVKGSKSKSLRRSDAVTGFIYHCRGQSIQLPVESTVADVSTSAILSTGGEDDDEVFESASENEWDPLHEEHDILDVERAAADAAAAEAAAEAGAHNGSADSPDPSSYGVSGAGSPQTNGTPTGGNTGSQPFKENSGKGGSSLFGLTLGGVRGMFKMSPNPSSSQFGPLPDESCGTPLATIEGSWLSHVTISGKRYWSLVGEKPDSWQPVQHPLPSDSRYRADLAVLATGDMKGAQKWKEQLETLQRLDKKAREAANGSSH